MKLRKVIIHSLLLAMLFTLLPYGRGNPDLEWFRDKYLEGRYKDVIKRADSILRKDPNNQVMIEYRNRAEEDQWVLEKAKKYYSAKDYQEAYVLFSRLLDSSPEAAYIEKLKAKARTYLLKQQEKVKKEEMLALKDKIASIRKAEEHIANGNNKKARSMLIELSALYPQDEKIRLLLSKIGVHKKPLSKPVSTPSYTSRPASTAPKAAVSSDKPKSTTMLLKQKKTLIKNFKVALSKQDLVEAQSILQVLSAKYPDDNYVQRLGTTLAKHQDAHRRRREALKQKAYKEKLASDLRATKARVAGLIRDRDYDQGLNEIASLEGVYTAESSVQSYVQAMRSKLNVYKEKAYRRKMSADFSLAKRTVSRLMKDRDYASALEEIEAIEGVYPQDEGIRKYAMAMTKKLDRYMASQDSRDAGLQKKFVQDKLNNDLGATKNRVSRSIKEKDYDRALNELDLMESLYPGERNVLNYTQSMRTKVQGYKLKASKDSLASDLALVKSRVAGLIRNKYYRRALSELETLEASYPNEASVNNYASAIKIKINRYLSKEQESMALAQEQEAQLDASRKALSQVQSARSDRSAMAYTPPEGGAAYSIKDKGAAIEQARNLIVLEDYEQAEETLIALKAEFPDDKEIDSLLNYVGLKLTSQPPERSGDASNQFAARDEEFYDDLSQGMDQSFDSSLWEEEEHDAEKLIKIREHYYKGIKLYRQGLYSQAINHMEKVVELEGNPRIYYTPSAKKLMRKAEDKRHGNEMQDALDKEETSDNLMLERSAQHSSTPYIEPEITEVLRKQFAVVEIPEIREKLEKVINLDFDNVSLKYVAEFIAQETGANIILSGQVLELKPKVTAKFDNIPAYQAIRYMLKSAGLAYRLDSDVVWIALPEEIESEALETKVYKLTKGAGLFTEFATSEKSGVGGGLSSFASISKIQTLEDTLKAAVDWSGGAKLVLDKRTNSLIITNTPKNLQIVEDILYNIDVPPYQILIEARFLEVDVTDVKELGVEWSFDTDATVQSENGAFKHGVASGSDVDFTAFTNIDEGLNLTYQGVLTDPQFQLVLHALQTSDKTKTLSAPRITTLNNQLATIKLVDEWIYPTRYEFQIVQFDLNGDGDFDDAGETEFQNVPTDFVRRDVGIILKVLPSMGIDGETVSLSLIPEVSEGTEGAFEYSGNVSLPLFTSRNLATTVVVTSGDTVVLGGMIREIRTNNVTGVPILSDLPFIGQLFRKNEDSIQRRNLLIFVTAKIISPSGKDVRTVGRK